MGAPVQAGWDSQLTAAMNAGGYVLEQAAADELVGDLEESAT